MKLLVCFFFFLGPIFSANAQDFFYLQNTSCLQDTINVSLTKREARSKKSQEIILAKTVEFLKFSIFEEIAEQNTINIEKINSIVCLLLEAEDNKKIKNKKNREFTFSHYREIVRLIEKGKGNKELLFFLYTIKIPELQNLFEARKIAIEKLELNKRTFPVGRIGRTGEKDAKREAEKGLLMLIRVYQAGLLNKVGLDKAIKDFENSIALLKFHTPQEYWGAERRRLKKIIGEGTGVYLQLQ